MNPIIENVVNVGSTNTGSIRLRDEIVIQSFTHLKLFAFSRCIKSKVADAACGPKRAFNRNGNTSSVLI